MSSFNKNEASTEPSPAKNEGSTEGTQAPSTKTRKRPANNTHDQERPPKRTKGTQVLQFADCTYFKILFSRCI
jgi:hypothetical protein